MNGYGGGVSAAAAPPPPPDMNGIPNPRGRPPIGAPASTTGVDDAAHGYAPRAGVVAMAPPLPGFVPPPGPVGAMPYPSGVAVPPSGAVASPASSSAAATSAATAASAAAALQLAKAARQQARYAGNIPSPAPRLKPEDGGPPYNVPIYPLFTRMNALEPGLEFPTIANERDQARVKAWMTTDLDYERANLERKKARKLDLNEIVDEALARQDWLGPGVDVKPSHKVRVKLENERDRDRRGGKRGPHRREVKTSKAQLRAIAKTKECLIPIRLEVEHEVYRLRDTFTWNLKETMVTPEIFASHLCEDLRLPSLPFYKEIVAQIKKHIEDAQMTENYVAHLGDDLAAVREENRKWFEEGRHRELIEETEGKQLMEEATAEGDETGAGSAEGPEAVKAEAEAMDVDVDAAAAPEPGPSTDLALAPVEASSTIFLDDYASDELRVTIKLDITIDSVQLVDRFEWDIGDPRNSPEEFAETFATELGLNGEFQTAICHSIREQIDVYTRSLCILGHAQGLVVPDEELRRQFLAPVSEPIRIENAADYTPLLNQLTPDEVDRNDKEREREVRRKRRQTKGRGVTLPDRDFVRTHRSVVPKSSIAPAQSYQDARGDTVYPMPEVAFPYPILPPPPIEKPPDLETNPASPLKLVHSKSTPGVPTAVGAGPNRLKRLKIVDGTLADGSGTATPIDGSGHVPGALEAHAVKRLGGPGRGRKGPHGSTSNLGALGLHPHFIDGVWHCANCGVPETVAVGRRKGPSGAHSLCGLCGKFFHRYRRNRPCSYTTDLETHRQIKLQADATAAAAKAAKLAAAAEARAAAAAAAAAGGIDASAVSSKLKRSDAAGAPATPSRASATRDNSSDESGNDDDSDDESSAPPTSVRPTPSNRSPRGPSSFVRGDSADSDMSSLSDSPRPSSAQSKTAAARSAAVGGKTILPAGAPAPMPSPASASISRPPPAGPTAPVQPAPTAPEWTKRAAAELRAKQVDDRFEIIPRPRPPDPTLQEWRIRCLDCPGKLYNLGPGETLDNFSVHFKNRIHRGNVEARIKGIPPPASAPPPPSAGPPAGG